MIAGETIVRRVRDAVRHAQQLGLRCPPLECADLAVWRALRPAERQAFLVRAEQDHLQQAAGRILLEGAQRVLERVRRRPASETDELLAALARDGDPLGRYADACR